MTGCLHLDGYVTRKCVEVDVKSQLESHGQPAEDEAGATDGGQFTEAVVSGDAAVVAGATEHEQAQREKAATLKKRRASET